ncbi:MAG: GNAT family N-acetyltransferase [Dysosmobacter welbionis]
MTTAGNRSGLRLDPPAGSGRAWRRRGYGVQLIGQAVMHYRPMGRDRLRLPTPETEAAAGFYREFGFSPAADGPAWEKFIGYDPEFLGT